MNESTMSMLKKITRQLDSQRDRISHISFLAYKFFSTVPVSAPRLFLKHEPQAKCNSRCRCSSKHFYLCLLRSFSAQSVFNNQPLSWLFVSNSIKGAYGAQVNLNLELGARLSGQSLEDLKANISARGIKVELDNLAADYETLTSLETVRKKLIAKRDTIRGLLQELSSEGKREETYSKWRSLKQELADVNQDLDKLLSNALWDLEESVMIRALKLPNDLHLSSPHDETVILKSTGGIIENYKRMSHVQIAAKFRLIKFSTVGPKALYLRGEVALAERALSAVVSEHMESLGFRLVSGPGFLKTPILEGCGQDVHDTEQVLTLQHVIKDVVEPMNHLVGTSPMMFVAYVAKTCVGDNHLPFKMFSCGTSYQNRDGPGLFGALQSTQAAFLTCVKESEVETHYEQTVDLMWTFLEKLGFAVRLCQVRSTDLRREEKRRTEVRVWVPSLDSYMAVAHVSDLGDFVSRRLMSCHNQNHGDIRSTSMLHMISGCMINITSLLAVWMEHSYINQESFSLCPLPGLHLDEVTRKH